MCLLKSCIRHRYQPLKMLEQDCRFVTLRRNGLETNDKILKKTQILENQNHSALLHMLNFQRHWLYEEMRWKQMLILKKHKYWKQMLNSSVYPTVCQHSRRLPNCLPTSPKMAQPSANIAQLFAINVIHRPTVCQLCRRPTNCLPTSCHSDHQIKSVRFLFGFLFFPSVIVWFCVFIFSQVVSWQLYISEWWQRKFWKSEYERGVYRQVIYFLCFGYDCILLFDCRDTRMYARVF